jgi:hypothetical protein
MMSKGALNGTAAVSPWLFSTAFGILLLMNRSQEHTGATDLRRWYRLGGMLEGFALVVSFLI